MMGRVKIFASAVAGVAAIGMFVVTISTQSTLAHLLTAADFYSRLAVVRGFELAYRVYSLPL
jgi:hypothetical protein